MRVQLLICWMQHLQFLPVVTRGAIEAAIDHCWPDDVDGYQQSFVSYIGTEKFAKDDLDGYEGIKCVKPYMMEVAKHVLAKRPDLQEKVKTLPKALQEDDSSEQQTSSDNQESENINNGDSDASHQDSDSGAAAVQGYYGALANEEHEDIAANEDDPARDAAAEWYANEGDLDASEETPKKKRRTN